MDRVAAGTFEHPVRTKIDKAAVLGISILILAGVGLCQSPSLSPRRRMILDGELVT